MTVVIVLTAYEIGARVLHSFVSMGSPESIRQSHQPCEYEDVQHNTRNQFHEPPMAMDAHADPGQRPEIGTEKR